MIHIFIYLKKTVNFSYENYRKMEKSYVPDLAQTSRRDWKFSL